MNRLIRTPVNTDTYCGPFRVRINEVWLEIKHEKVQARCEAKCFFRTLTIDKVFLYLLGYVHTSTRRSSWQERGGVTSRFHGSKSYGSQQTLLEETAIATLHGLPFWSWELSFAQKRHTCQVFRFFGHFCRTTVCWDLKILLPWQRDVTNSPLYRSHSLE